MRRTVCGIVCVSVVLAAWVIALAPRAQAATLLIEITNPGTSSFGRQVVAGDFDGDGFSDFAVGTTGSEEPEKVFVYYGRASPPSPETTPDVTLTDVLPSVSSETLASMDFNADTYDDLLVMGPAHIDVKVFYGGPTGVDTTVDLALTGSLDPARFFGRAIADAGDVNGDGWRDAIVGEDGNGTATGSAYIFYGGPGANGDLDLTLEPSPPSTGFGWTVTGAGDIQGDGCDDVAVGDNFKGLFATSKIYVYRGVPSGNACSLELTQVVVNCVVCSTKFAYSVSGIGDVNGDGYDDFLVGHEVGGKNRYQAYVYLGGPSVPTTPSVTLTGEQEGDFFGFSHAALGDCDGNGFDDFAVGAHGYDVPFDPDLPSGDDFGRAYVFRGSSNLDQLKAPDEKATGLDVFDGLGIDVANGGDYNGDGHVDLLLGMLWTYGHALAFTTGIVCGQAPPIADFTWTPTFPNEGQSVTFTDQSSDPDGTIVAWSWDMDDGHTFTTQNPSHTFGDDSGFAVSLTVTDNAGATATTTRTVTVANLAPTILYVNSTVFPNEPRTHGYWQHQYPCTPTTEITGEHPGIKPEYMDFIHANSRVWATATVEDVCEDLFAGEGSAPMLLKLRMQVIAVWLNVASKKLAYDAVLHDPLYPGASSVRELLVIAEDAIISREAGNPTPTDEELEDLKDVADRINNADYHVIDPELGIFEARVTDPGSDDLRFDWDFNGDGLVDATVIHYSAGGTCVGPSCMFQDPDPSSHGAFPISVIDVQVVGIAASPNPVKLTVSDDDGGVAVNEDPGQPWSVDWAFSYTLEYRTISGGFVVPDVTVYYVDLDAIVIPIDPYTGQPMPPGGGGP